jgi:MoxR-like ATPase
MADLDDVRAVALPVLRHRVVTNFAAEAAGRTNDDVVRELVAGSGWTA